MKKKPIRRKKAYKKTGLGERRRKSSSKRLSYQEIAEIISRAIKSQPQEFSFGKEVLLGHVLPSTEARKLFRKNVHRLIGSRGFIIKQKKIPITPNLTLHRITRALTISALPGDPTTSDPI
jgi:hypothetical protein